MKLYLLKTAYGTGESFTHFGLRRVFLIEKPPFHIVYEINTQCVISHQNPSHLGFMIRNLNKGMFDTSKLRVDTNNFIELKELTYQVVEIDRLLIIDVPNDFDTLINHYIPHFPYGY